MRVSMLRYKARVLELVFLLNQLITIELWNYGIIGKWYPGKLLDKEKLLFERLFRLVQIHLLDTEMEKSLKDSALRRCNHLRP